MFEENNNRPPAVPSKRQTNPSSCQTPTLPATLLDKLLPNLMPYEQVPGLDQAAVQQLYARTLLAKTQIIETADNHVNLLKVSCKRCSHKVKSPLGDYSAQAL
ncbi:hypothetical protein O9993_17460 [Vibrio lentus]|nr:hypothetical protein [Vibrio lentus]